MSLIRADVIVTNSFHYFSNDEYPVGLLLHARAAGRGGFCPGVRRGEEVGMEPERISARSRHHAHWRFGEEATVGTQDLNSPFDYSCAHALTFTIRLSAKEEPRVEVALI